MQVQDRASQGTTERVTDLVRHHAGVAPDHVAVEDSGGTMTYRDLVAAADRVAANLRSVGVTEGALVGLCMDRSIDAIVALLGILRAGAVYVPVDPRYPPDRIRYSLDDADVCLVVADSAGAVLLDGLNRPVHILEGSRPRGGPFAGADMALPDTRRVDGGAYVVYTSGSTGRPKGVAVGHGALGVYAGAMRSRLGVEPTDRYLHTASFAFSSSVRQWALPLTSGATLVMAGPQHVADARVLLEFIQQRRITVADLVPSYLRSCVHALRDEDAGARRVLMKNDLRLLVTASEPLAASVVHAWRDELGHPARMVNMFGQTETCGIVSTYEIPDDLPEEGIVPVGFPLDGVEVFVVDASGRRAPPGEPGELVVSGPTLGLGYLGFEDAARTAFALGGDERRNGLDVYRTGDRGRVRPDGVIEFLGRMDTQVKVRGHRVELEEVEARLAAHPSVAAAAVMAGEGPGDETTLVGVVVARSGEEIDAASLRRFVRAALPEHMVPSTVVRTEALPRTPNGKLDRGALPNVPGTRLGLSRAYVAPAGEAEELVASLWSDLLETPDVGADDDFFELGGHSLLGMRVMARLRTATGVDLPVRVLFEDPTVAGLAARIVAAGAGGTDAGSRAGPAPGSPHAEVRPSFAQKRLWLLHQMDSESAAYNLFAAIRLGGALDLEALERSVARVVERHETLRMVFPAVGGEPTARVMEALPVRLSPEPVESEPRMRARVVELAARPYDLEAGPLFRASLLRLASEEHVLVLGMHHIVSDGWSRGVLYDEIASLYSAFAGGGEDPLPPLPVRFRDYVAWQDDVLADDVLEPQLRWWKEHLAGVPATSELPLQRPRPAIQSFRGETSSFSIPEGLAREVRRFGAEEGASPFMVYLAALAALTHRYTGQDEVVLGTPTAGRSDSSVEPLIGFFVNTLALRLDPGARASFRDLVKAARDTALEVFARQDVPFDRVVDGLKLPRDLSRSPLFQIMLIVQNTPRATRRPAELAISEVEVALGAAKYDLTLSLVTGERGLTGHLEFNTDLFDREFIDRLGGHFVELVSDGVARPDRPIGELRLLTSDEHHELLVRWNDTSAPVEDHATVHGLFERQARATPDATAVVSGDERLTYDELDRRATTMAHALRALGVGRETLVGVSVDRSLDMIVGLLGILKAGGAYVPLDPTYPRERLQFMIEDSGLAVLLTREHLLDQMPPCAARTVCIDRDWEELAATPKLELPAVDPEQLAYVIFTSGSTGRPKGVMVEHRNVANFFTGMDARIAPDGPVRWLAVTSISFDISVLELFWTLARGCEVVIQPDEPQALVRSRPASTRPIDFSLFYFASEAQSDRTDPYHLLFEGARFADANGFSGIWVPERHFHEFGGIYPSPAVMASALAMVTRNVKIRTGSVVLPLHDTVRVAEDWAVVDNLSKGRVQLSFASGWHDRDFIFQPQNYQDRRGVMIRQMDELRRLWRGESITRQGGEGTPHEISTFPRPIQPELPVFVTAAGTPETFEAAGREGAHLLTHLLGQTVEQLADKIRMYRQAWDSAGHTGRGTVALMMHTFVGDDLDEVRETVRGPFRSYLRSSVGLISGLAKGRGQDIRSADFTDEDMEALLDHAFDRYFETSALMGTLNSCAATVERLKDLDVDDVACLIDFGVPEHEVIGSLGLLAELRRRVNRSNDDPAEAAASEPPDDYASVPEQIVRHRITHLQCTPSYAEIVLAQPGGREALGTLECLMVGGEALPLGLARALSKVVPGRLMNMYGPTETTIWSSTEVVDPDDAPVSLGRPIVNTDFLLVDRYRQPVPIGVPGELLIGGKGVVRGYWERPELTEERFISHPAVPGERVYRTGDLTRYRRDGRLDFLGRIDHQVKVRGHRIELGEIETRLAAHVAVREAVVVAREDVPGDKRLVGYVVLGSAVADAEAALREDLRTHLPEWMVPQHIVVLSALPRTPNGKTDRKGLPAPGVARAATEYVAPASDIERIVAEVWQEVLRRPNVGVEDNFFDLGGHSLLTVRVQSLLRERLERPVPITDLFRFPTVRGLAARLGGDAASRDASAVLEAVTDRARARRGAMAARRRGRS